MQSPLYNIVLDVRVLVDGTEPSELLVPFLCINVALSFWGIFSSFGIGFVRLHLRVIQPVQKKRKDNWNEKRIYVEN